MECSPNWWSNISNNGGYIYLPVAMVTRRNGLCRWCFDQQCDLWDKCPSVLNENLSNLAQTYTVHTTQAYLMYPNIILYYPNIILSIVWEILIIYIAISISK